MSPIPSSILPGVSARSKSDLGKFQSEFVCSAFKTFKTLNNLASLAPCHQWYPNPHPITAFQWAPQANTVGLLARPNMPSRMGPKPLRHSMPGTSPPPKWRERVCPILRDRRKKSLENPGVRPVSGRGDLLRCRICGCLGDLGIWQDATHSPIGDRLNKGEHLLLNHEPRPH